jgi:hypothetical protein
MQCIHKKPASTRDEAMKNGVSAASLAEVVVIPPAPNDDSQVSAAANIFVRGGCSDPRVIPGSIIDAVYKRRKSSHIGKVRFAAQILKTPDGNAGK